MGGHGGLNILPKKTWNVYNRENIARVRRDESRAQRLEQEQKDAAAQSERDARRAELLSRRHPTSGDADAAASKHVNLFEEEERKHARKEGAHLGGSRDAPGGRGDDLFRFARACGGRNKPWYAAGHADADALGGVSLPGRLRREREAAARHERARDDTGEKLACQVVLEGDRSDGNGDGDGQRKPRRPRRRRRWGRSARSVLRVSGRRGSARAASFPPGNPRRNGSTPATGTKANGQGDAKMRHNIPTFLSVLWKTYRENKTCSTRYHTNWVLCRRMARKASSAAPGRKKDASARPPHGAHGP